MRSILKFKTNNHTVNSTHDPVLCVVAMLKRRLDSWNLVQPRLRRCDLCSVSVTLLSKKVELI